MPRAIVTGGKDDSRRELPRRHTRTKRSSSSKASRSVGTDAAPPSPGPLEAWVGGVLLACAVVFNVAGLAPEALIERIPVNDLVFHRAAAERLGASLLAGEPFLEPWVSEWSLGYPVWRSYQPLPHLLAALVLGLAHPVADPDAAFAILFFVLVATLPVSVFAGARLLGLSPPAAGLAALLVFAPSATGDVGQWGLGYGAFLWRGSGLYTQAVALHLLALALGVTARALDRGRRPTLAAVLLALTALSHIVFGYVAFVSAALLALVGPRDARSERLARLAPIAAAALALLAWFLVPLALGMEIVNHSRWEEARKWDSYGAPFILGELLAGRLLDFGRAPLLTVLLGAGVAGAVLRRREPVAGRLLALAGLWLALFCGRETWGHLLLLAGIPADLHLHRLQAAFELSAVLLASFGVTRLLEALLARARPLGLAAAALAAAAVVTIGVERAGHLGQNATWGEQSMAAYGRESGDLESALMDVRAVLAERPGRVSAGPAAGWGGAFRIGSVKLYSVLTRAHLDQASFLYHAMSKTSDLMVLRNENDPAHDAAFAVRVVIAPADRPMPPHLRRRALHGRFAVYEASPEGYFGLADIAGHYVGPAATRYEPSASWLASPLPGRGLVISLDARAAEGPALARWAPLPVPAPATPPPGRVLSETKAGETYGARVRLDRPAHVLVRITWSPDLVATVDGNPAPLLHVTPGSGRWPCRRASTR